MLRSICKDLNDERFKISQELLDIKRGLRKENFLADEELSEETET